MCICINICIYIFMPVKYFLEENIQCYKGNFF